MLFFEFVTGKTFLNSNSLNYSVNNIIKIFISMITVNSHRMKFSKTLDVSILSELYK